MIKLVYSFLDFNLNKLPSRLMEAYGTNDLEAPLTYKVEVFMLLGRKPTS